MSNLDDPVILGRFGRPHGVRGEVRFFSYNPDSPLLVEGTELHLEDGSVVTIENIRSAARFEIVKLQGIDDRDNIQIVRNQEAGVPRDAFPEPDPDEFYLVDLIGFDVLGQQSDDDALESVGTVDGFLEGTSVEVMAIVGPRLRGRLLVPMTDDALDEIVLEEAQVVLRPFDHWAVPDEPIFGEKE